MKLLLIPLLRVLGADARRGLGNHFLKSIIGFCLCFNLFLAGYVGAEKDDENPNPAQEEGTQGDPDTAEEGDSEQNTDQPEKPKKQIKRANPNIRASLLKSLAEYQPEDEVLWLEGKESDPNAVMALYIPANQPKVRGGMLLIHDANQHPDWPVFIQELRQNMPDHGWHTLSLSMSYGKPLEIPARELLTLSGKEFPYAQAKSRFPPLKSDKTDGTEEAPVEEQDVTDESDEDVGEEMTSKTEVETEQEGEGNGSNVDIDAKDSETGDAVDPSTADSEPESPPEKPPLANTERIDLGLQQLEASGIRNRILIGVGKGVAELVEFLSSSPDSVTRAEALVWVNADISIATLKALNETAPAFSGLKLLDIYDSGDLQQKELAKERQRFARRLGMKHYYSAPLAGLDVASFAGSTRLTNRVWSWLEALAPSRIKKSR